MVWAQCDLPRDERNQSRAESIICLLIRVMNPANETAFVVKDERERNPSIESLVGRQRKKSGRDFYIIRLLSFFTRLTLSQALEHESLIAMYSGKTQRRTFVSIDRPLSMLWSLKWQKTSFVMSNQRVYCCKRHSKFLAINIWWDEWQKVSNDASLIIIGWISWQHQWMRHWCLVVFQ